MEMDEEVVDEAPIFNWEDFDLKEELVQTLKNQGYQRPTEVQSHSLKYIKYFTDLIISARTGEGKTLCFLLPILNNLITKYEKKLEEEGLTHESSEEELKPIQNEWFRSIKALILSPTRELCIQIKEHCEKVIPERYKKLITVWDLIGGMSVQKQERLLSYRPTIIIGTVGRIWELLDNSVNEFLSSSLPKLDVMVLDEADRMVELGHFKELNFILDFVYLKREEESILKVENEKNKDIKASVLKTMKNDLDDNEKFYLGKNLENKHGNDEYLKNLIDNAEDLGDDFEDIKEADLIIDDQEIEEMEQKIAISHKKKKNKSNHDEMLLRKKKKTKEEEFKPKNRGVQTIVCSASLILDSKGRIRPSKKSKKNDRRENFDALEELWKKLRFKQKRPKVINLTENLKLPSKLVEIYQRCQNDEKDLYIFYFLQNHFHESTIIFVNSITCIKRVGSMLDILKVPHRILHSRMQQRARLKNFDRFRRDVENLSADPTKESAVLVCTDVGARGLDIPNVNNIIHYQMPENAEVYLHRWGRTARIGKEGLALSLFAPQDEKKFKLIYKVLKGKANLMNLHEDIKPMKVSVVELKRYEGFITVVLKYLMNKKVTQLKIFSSFYNIYLKNYNKDLIWIEIYLFCLLLPLSLDYKG